MQASGTPRSRSCWPPSASTPQRAPLEVLLERAIVATGYDLAVLARPGGDRRLANLRKLMRLAGEYERAEGRDLRGFLADAAARDLAEAREGEAALESEGLDAVRLMTIHRAKGLEFPVVCVADLGRKAGARALAAAGRPTTARPACGSPRSAAATRSRPPPGSALADAEAAADAEEERRLFYVAMTRARELLILSGGTDVDQVAGAAPRRPADRLDRPRRRRRGARATAERCIERALGRPPGARRRVALNTPETLARPAEARARAAPARPRRREHDRAARRSPPSSRPARPGRGPRRSGSRYSQLTDYAQVRLPLLPRRVLGLPDVDAAAARGRA